MIQHDLKIEKSYQYLNRSIYQIVKRLFKQKCFLIFDPLFNDVEVVRVSLQDFRQMKISVGLDQKAKHKQKSRQA